MQWGWETATLGILRFIHLDQVTSATLLELPTQPIIESFEISL